MIVDEESHKNEIIKLSEDIQKVMCGKEARHCFEALCLVTSVVIRGYAINVEPLKKDFLLMLECYLAIDKEKK